MSRTDEIQHLSETFSYDSVLKSSYTSAPAYTTFNRGYTGHEHLDNFGLINMNGRMYDPSLGRFLSADPILQNPTSAQGHNRYSYVLNNPLKYTDPSGYKVKPAGWDAPWESSAYVNFGPKGGSLSGNYWAVDYRTTEGNWAAMSQSTFNNLYGAGNYENCYKDIRINLAASLAEPGNFVTWGWNPYGGRELYRVLDGKKIYVICEGNYGWISNGKYPGREYRRSDDSGEESSGGFLSDDASTVTAIASSLANMVQGSAELTQADALAKIKQVNTVISAEKEAFKTMGKIATGAKFLGSALGVVSIADHFSKARSSFSNGDIVNGWLNVGKVGIDGALMIMKSNPIVLTISVVYSIADVSGYLDYKP